MSTSSIAGLLITNNSLITTSNNFSLTPVFGVVTPFAQLYLNAGKYIFFIQGNISNNSGSNISILNYDFIVNSSTEQFLIQTYTNGASTQFVIGNNVIYYNNMVAFVNISTTTYINLSTLIVSSSGIGFVPLISGSYTYLKLTN